MGQPRYSWSYWWWSGFPPPHTHHQGGPEILGGPVSLLMVLLVVEWLPSPYPTQGGPKILGGPASLLMVLLVVEWLPSPPPHTRRPGDPRWASLVTHGPIGGGVASLPPPHTQGGPEILGGPVSLLMVLLVVEWLPSPLLHTRRPGDPRWASLVTHGPIGGGVASPHTHTRRPGDPRWASLGSWSSLVVEWLPLTPTPHKEARRS